MIVLKLDMNCAAIVFFLKAMFLNLSFYCQLRDCLDLCRVSQTKGALDPKVLEKP